MSANDVTAFEKIESKRKTNPSKSTRELLAGSGVNPAAYYRGRKVTLGGSEKKAPKPKPKPAPKAAAKRRRVSKESTVGREFTLPHFNAPPMLLLIGSPEQMKQTLAGAL